MKTVDLHVHSNRSDGIFSPDKIIEIVIEKGLAGFALTDHDCFDGIALAEEIIRTKQLPLFFIAGCEFSTYLESPGEVHILGYFRGHSYKKMSGLLDEYIKSRVKRAYRIEACLKKCGIDIKLDDLIKNSGAPIGRMHIAREMTRLGYTSNNREAFEKYLGRDCSCYIPRREIKTYDLISSIRENGGRAVVAHPFFLNKPENSQYIDKMIDAGLEGIEFSHPKINNSLSRKIKEKYSEKLILTSGSDFHGDEKSESIGKYGIDVQTAEKYFPGFSDFS
ncbi:MAG: PHP domain-containing protein [Brevinematales bacterium]